MTPENRIDCRAKALLAFKLYLTMWRSTSLRPGRGVLAMILRVFRRGSPPCLSSRSPTSSVNISWHNFLDLPMSPEWTPENHLAFEKLRRRGQRQQPIDSWRLLGTYQEELAQCYRDLLALGALATVDWRPGETMPEDFYAL